MTKYREILRLRSLGLSQRSIAASCHVSRNSVSKVCAKADELSITWPLNESMTDEILGKMMFPKETIITNRHMPDFEYVRKELMRNGVNKNYCGLNTAKNVACLAILHLCILSFVI